MRLPRPNGSRFGNSFVSTWSLVEHMRLVKRIWPPRPNIYATAHNGRQQRGFLQDFLHCHRKLLLTRDDRKGERTNLSSSINFWILLQFVKLPNIQLYESVGRPRLFYYDKTNQNSKKNKRLPRTIYQHVLELN